MPGKPSDPTDLNRDKLTASDSLDTSQPGVHETEAGHPTSPSKLPGQFGRYQILRQLGAGAMGAVYLAHDTQLDRQVALKTPSFDGDPDPELIKRFYREARSAATLLHPNICSVHDVGEIDGVHFITMAYIEGRPLSAFIEHDKPLPKRTIAVLVRKLALALADAHQRGVIHRDLKPANIMLERNREPIVMDFGLARRDDSSEQSRMTQSGVILGTPAYMSTEQVQGDPEKIGPASDQYSLGVILYELLSGQLPFRGSVAAVIGKIMTQHPPKPSEHRPDVEEELEAICLRMMAKQPTDRYGSMKEVAEVLAMFLTGERHAVPRKAQGIQGRPEDQRKQLADSSGKEDSADAQLRGFFETQKRLAVHSCESRPPLSAAPQLGKTSTTRGRWQDASVMLRITGGALIVLLICTVTLLLHTPQGTLRIEIDDPTLLVEIDGGKITLSDTDPSARLAQGEHLFAIKLGELLIPVGQTVELSTANYQGSYRLSVSLGDTELVGDRLTVISEGQSVLRVALLPHDRGPLKSTNPGTRGLEPERVIKLVPPAPADSPFDAIQADHHQSAWSKYLGVPDESTNSVGMRFALIPAGSFDMGTSQEVLATLGNSVPKWYGQRESPQTRIEIIKPFLIGAHEVTQSAYEQVVGSNPSHFASGGAGQDKVTGRDTSRHPVDNVSWLDVVVFCNELSKREALPLYYSINGENVAVRGRDGYRLPTEAEWEFACRAGTTTQYCFGDDPADLDQYAWRRDNRTHPVGEKAPNAFGLYDVHGNVYEHCQDRFGNYRSRLSTIDPTGPARGNRHVVRGGSAQQHPTFNFRCAFRSHNAPTHRQPWVGLRVARTILSNQPASKPAGRASDAQ